MSKPAVTQLLSLAIKFQSGHEVMVPVETFDDPEALEHWRERLQTEIGKVSSDAPAALKFLGIQALGTSTTAVQKHESRVKLASVLPVNGSA